MSYKATHSLFDYENESKIVLAGTLESEPGGIKNPLPTPGVKLLNLIKSGDQGAVSRAISTHRESNLAILYAFQRLRPVPFELHSLIIDVVLSWQLLVSDQVITDAIL